MSLPSETQVDDAVKGGVSGVLSASAILGHIFAWWPQAAVDHLVDVTSAAVLGAVSAFYLGRKLYRSLKGTTTA